jgi:hypothetical protein
MNMWWCFFVIYFNCLAAEIITKTERHHNHVSLFSKEKIVFYTLYNIWILFIHSRRSEDASEGCSKISNLAESSQKNRETLVE